MTNINLRYLEATDDLVISIVLMPREYQNEIKDRILAKLGINRNREDSHHTAWLRAMCEENGYKFEMPLPREVRDAITENFSALRFSFVLA